MIVPYYFKRGPMLGPRTSISWSQRFREITNWLAPRATGSSQNDSDSVVEETVTTVEKSAHARS